MVKQNEYKYGMGHIVVGKKITNEKNTVQFELKLLCSITFFSMALAVGYAEQASKKYSDYKEINDYYYGYIFSNYLNVSTEVSGSATQTMSGSSDGWGVGLGFSFHKYLGFEFAHYNYGQVHYENPNLLVDELESNSSNLALVVKAPLGRFEPFVRWVFQLGG